MIRRKYQFFLSAVAVVQANTVSFMQPMRVGNAWLVRWTSQKASPIYQVTINGVNQGTTTATSWLVQPGDQIDVSDLVGTEPQVNYPKRVTLQWTAVNGTVDHYRVDRWDGAAWEVMRNITHQSDQVYYQYITGDLADDTDYLYRITPVNAGGLDGTPREFSFLMVRRPDVPAVTCNYDQTTGNLTIAAI